MRKVFWENPYQDTLDTTVVYLNKNEALFNETIVFSFSGGQESDKATVNGIQILSSRIEANNIFYLLPEGHGLSVGDMVTMQIDWPRRHNLMRLHFACELILVIINRLFGKMPTDVELKPEEIDNLGPRKTGAHISEHKARIDFRLEENISIYFSEILKEYNRIINADLEIIKGYIDELTQVRYWRIEGVATVPCGGTHVKTTSEVGFVNLKRERVGKGIERIEIKLLNL